MSKKSKHPKRKKSLTTNPSQADKWFDLMGQQIVQGNYTEAIANGERLLRHLPQQAPLRADVLTQLGIAHSMLQNFPQSYEAFTQALERTPNNAELWYNRGLKLMEAGKWDQAGQAFQSSIAMGDCLPQPWGNLGISLMMQQRYDEAEAALKRALVIDPAYTLAKKNLAMLPEIRRTGPPEMIEIRDPFKDSKIKQSITFLVEE